MNMHYRAFYGPADWGWVQQQIPGLKRVEDTSGIVGVNMAVNETVAACIFDNWTESSVHVHQIVTNPFVLRHGFFEEVADYVFNVCGRHLMIGLVPSDMEKVIELDRKIGFREATRIPDAYRMGVDTVVMTMTAEQCNFYRPVHEKVAAHG